MCLWTRMCVCLLVKVGVCESHCVQLWSRWRPPAPSICLIFLLPPSFIRSPRHANNLQLGQSWLAPCLCTHPSQSHSEMHNSNSPQHETCFKKLNQLELEMPAFFFFYPLLLSRVDILFQSSFFFSLQITEKATKFPISQIQDFHPGD